MLLLLSLSSSPQRIVREIEEEKCLWKVIGVKKDVVTLTTTARTKRYFVFIVPSQKKLPLASSSLTMFVMFDDDFILLLLFAQLEIKMLKNFKK
jgi:hypothetical protein